MAMSGVSQLAYLVPELWSPSFYAELRANLPMANFFTREYEGQISAMGDTVNVQQIGKATGETLTDDTSAFTPELMTVNQIQVIANKRASASFEFSDLAQLQSISFQNAAREALVYGCQKIIEDAIIAALVPSAAAPDHQIAPASASDLAAADVAGMRTLLSKQSVPNTNRALFLDPAYFGDLMQKTTIASSDFIPQGSPTSTGSLPMPIYGANVVEHQGLSADVGYMAHNSALAVVMQPGLRLKISDRHSSLYYSYVMSADIVFGVKLMDNKRVVKISG